MQEPLKMFSPWRRYSDVSWSREPVETINPIKFLSILMLYSVEVVVCAAWSLMHLWRSPCRWCSTWVSTSSRSSCTTRSSSTSSTAPRMHWGGCWESTASLLKSHGEVQIQYSFCALKIKVSKKPSCWNRKHVSVSEFCLLWSPRTWWPWRLKVRLLFFLSGWISNVQTPSRSLT